jgi:hypothetical protein
VTQTDLKNEIIYSVKHTPESWGEPYLVIDESAACDMMSNCFGGEMEAADYQAQLDEIDVEHTIYELNGRYYAVEDPHMINTGWGCMRWNNDRQYVECENPSNCTDGLLETIGQWQSFDD